MFGNPPLKNDNNDDDNYGNDDVSSGEDEYKDDESVKMSMAENIQNIQLIPETYLVVEILGQMLYIRGYA